ncbi:hypothetical protein M378DRAFT_101176 [Amanita muscaria Koide BX008]|uniref:Uncharacterized protein n=1 Tax=Amanita muscaria (strain Koide BX008) TaxID=946122 RepID=A0A0C2XFW2_AMAMK|nr:hypothetical protein M378DRAFT_101176 [Amanita muscaria Koide BX008]
MLLDNFHLYFMDNHYELVSAALEANKAHQSALASRAQALTAQIHELDCLLVSTRVFKKTLPHAPVPVLADATNALDERDGKRLNTAISVRGGVKPVALLQPSALLKPASVVAILSYQHLTLLNRNHPFTTKHHIGHGTRNIPCRAKVSVLMLSLVPIPLSRIVKRKELETLLEAVQLEKQRARSLSQPSPCEEAISEELDWTAVAERVSAAHGNARTADECRIKWEEQSSNNTTRQRNIPRSAHVWSAESDLRLREAVDRYGYDNWLIVAKTVSENATASQCEGRFFRMVDPSIKKGLWTQEEDARLRKAVEAHGNSWIDVASTMSGRTNNQCRERWMHQQKMASSGTKRLDKDYDV